MSRRRIAVVVVVVVLAVRKVTVRRVTMPSILPTHILWVLGTHILWPYMTLEGSGGAYKSFNVFIEQMKARA